MPLWKQALLRRLHRPLDGEGDDLPGGGDDSGEAIGTGNDARVRLLEQINDANDQLRADELASVNDDGSTEAYSPQDLTPSDDDGVTAAELARMEAETADPEAAAPAPTQQKHKIKVNGRELELTQEEILARASKIEAADQYLAEAARMRREAEAYATQNAVPSQPAVPPDAQAPQDLRALVRAIQMGTEEDAVAALQQLQSMSRAPQLSHDDLARTVDERLTFKEAVSRFESEYSDILADPNLRAMALQRDQQMVAQGDKRSYWDRYQSIGSDLRGWRDNLIKSATPAPTTPATQMQGKQAAKATAAQKAPPATAARKAAPAAQEDSDESVSDVIASIAKARGGPQWARA